MRTKYTRHFSTKETPQSEPIPGSGQVMNNAGGYSFKLDKWGILDRFLILGSESSTYYASAQTLTRENADSVLSCIKEDGVRVVNRITEISVEGRAPKNDPAIFALAMASKLGDEATRRAANSAVSKVCRIPTHLAQFAESVKAFGGWGRGTRRAISRWYSRPVGKLAYQLSKYQSRGGWSNADLVRKAHVKPQTEEHKLLFRWAGAPYAETNRSVPVLSGDDVSKVPANLRIVWAFEQAKRAESASEVVKLIQDYGLPRECVPTQFRSDPKVWEALLPGMGITAMIRNLGNMTKAGLLASNMSEATSFVVSRITDQERLISGRVHPVQVLSALMTYKSGHGARGKGSWEPVGGVVDALDEAFYLSFKAVEPAGKRMLLALDVSGSMGWVEIAGIPGLTPRIGSAAMSLVTAATEKSSDFVAFTGANGVLFNSTVITRLSISSRQRLDDVVRHISNLPFSGTDCSLPMLWALENKVEVDTFIVYTDSDTWAGKIHPLQALDKYRQRTGIPAQLIVVGMVANDISIADPNDPGMLDVCGFDTATPAVISDFARGSLAGTKAA